MTLRPNVGIEYVFAPRWSASLNFDVAWWRQRSKDRFYQIWTLSPEIRYWFGGYSPSRSFYVGVHAISGSYDLKNGDVGYWNESLVEAGLSLGYVMRLSPNWSLRFGLGGGYLNTSYKKYIRYNDIGEHYVYDGTDRTTYWGITKAEVSFRWNFGRRK